MITTRNAGGLATLVEEWFGAHARELPWRGDYDPYHVWISEFMAQQTRMEVVLRHLPRFLAAFPSIAALASADEEAVVAAWSGLGYYRRARMLHRSAREIVERFDGRLPDDAETLRTLHGFGPYTSGAVASIAYGKREPLADGNVARLVARLEALDAPWRSRELESRAWEVAALLVERCASPRALNQGLMELGARVCRPKKPACDECPLSRHCQAFRDDATGRIPRPPAKKAVVELEVPVWLIADARGRVLMRRSSGPLMTGMFQLPVGTPEPFGDPLPLIDPGPLVASFTHTITHRRIRFHVHEPKLPDMVADSGGEWVWISPDELDRVPHPSWVRKALFGVRRVSAALKNESAADATQSRRRRHVRRDESKA